MCNLWTRGTWLLLVVAEQSWSKASVQTVLFNAMPVIACQTNEAGGKHCD